MDAVAVTVVALPVLAYVIQLPGLGGVAFTQQSVDTLVARPPGLTDRGLHALKGTSAAMQVFGLDPRADAISA